MFSAMKALPRHHRPLLAGRLLCLTVMAILLANPVLATVSATLACNGQGCCCADAEQTAAVTIRSIAAKKAACCRQAESAPCRMSSGNLPDAVPALVHTPDRQSIDPVHLLSGCCRTAADLLPFPSPGSRFTGVPTFSGSPVYLRTCRLIC
jgi:hypothetical protein